MAVLDLVKNADKPTTVAIPVPTPTRSPDASFWQRVFCIFGQHEMVVKDESTWQRTMDGRVVAKGPMYIVRCKHCGKMKANCL